MLLLFLVIPALFALSPNPEPALKEKPVVEKVVYPSDNKVKELAVKIESLLSSAIIDPQYEDEYIKNADIPVSIRANFKERYKVVKDINKIKDFGRARELGNGYIEANETASVDEKDKIKLENANREELFKLISSYLNIADEKEKASIPSIYGDVILNIKEYAVAEPVEPTKPIDNNVVSSIATSYKYKMVSDVLFKILKELDFDIDGKTQKKFEGTVTVNYKCATEQRSFIIKVCQIKGGKLIDCKDSKNSSLYSTIDDGSMVWIEKGLDKDKTLVIPDTRSEDQSIKLCPNDVADFAILEKISSSLIEEEEKAKLKAEEEKKAKKEKAEREAKKKAEKKKKQEKSKNKNKKKK